MKKHYLFLALLLFAATSAWAVTITVGPSGPPTYQYATIQAAVAAAGTNDIIHVYPGIYSSGAYVILDKQGLQILGVDASGIPITSAASVLATVGPLTGGEADMVFHVIANDVTISGIRISDLNNKAMTINGDNFTLTNCLFANQWDLSGSIYFYDASPGIKSDVNKSVQKTFTITGNVIKGWGVAITDGTGYGWPASGRVISGNTFGISSMYPGYSFYSIGFRSVNSTGWCNSPVGGATITGNNFADMGSHGYVWFDGTVPVEGLDFAFIMANNTFAKGAVMAFDPTTGAARIQLSSDPDYGPTKPNLVKLKNVIANEIAKSQVGDIINVAAGTYKEQLTISKALTLNGSDGAVLNGSGLAPTWTTGVQIKSGNVTFNNIDVTNFTQDGIICGYEASPPGNLQNIHITNCKVSNIQPGNWGFGIYVGYESEGFGYIPPKLTAHLDYSGLLIENNEITNTHSSALVLQSITGTPGTLQIKNNNIHDNTTNDGIWIDCARNLTIENNISNNNKWGIEFSAYAEADYTLNGPYGPKDISVTGNQFNNNTEEGFALYNGWPATISINGNSIVGNGLVNRNYLTATLNATCNWWGSTVPATIAAKISGPVTYIPYRISDGGACTGYPPVLVKRSGIIISGYSSIQPAINAATTLAGDVIEVAAGTYDVSGVLNITKSLTFNGANAGIAGTGTRGEEAILIDSRTPATNDGAITISTTSAVVLDGFKFQGSKVLTGQIANANLNFKNNRFILNAMPNTGQTNMIFSTGCHLTLDANYFETTGFNASNSAVFHVEGGYTGGTSGVDMMTMTNNYFKGIPDAGNLQSTLQLNFNKCQGTVSGNTFDGVDIGVIVAGTSGNFIVSSNTFKNQTRGASEINSGSFAAGILIYNPTYSGPVNISGNTFQNSDCGIRTSNAGGAETGTNIHISGNTFTSNLFDIVHKYPTGTLSLDGDNIMAGVTLSSATPSQLFTIEDKIVHKIDYSGYGLVVTKATNLYVTTNSYFSPAGTTSALIQRGIDAATSTWTVNVAAGTYHEWVNITKSLILQGAKAGSDARTRSTSSGESILDGIYLSTGNTASEIQGNTIKNISWANTGSVTWSGIYLQGTSVANIGTTLPNVIGEATGNGSITFTAGASDAILYGIYLHNTEATTVANNTIGSITALNTSAANATNICGIYKYGEGTLSLSSNTIGSTDAATTNSIYASSTATDNEQRVFGINSAGTGTVSISGNTISKLTNGTTNANTATLGLIDGIFISNGTNTVENNTIRDLTIANANTTGAHTASAGGLIFNVGIAVIQTISGNTIYNLSNSNVTFAGNVTGLHYNGSQIHGTVTGNFIHSLSTSSSLPGASLYGISIIGGNPDVINNIISLGAGLTNGNAFYGIKNANTDVNTNLYFNTVDIEGTATGATGNTYAVSDDGLSRDYRNNIFNNTRSGGSTGKHYAISLSSISSLTIDYNDYYAPNGVLGNLSGDITTLADWRIATGKDLHSANIDPGFALSGGTNAADYLPSEPTLLAVTGTGVLKDYTNADRFYPSMGAFDYPVGPMKVEVTATSGDFGPTGYYTLKAAFDKINDGTHQGAVTIKILGNTLETATALLNASLSGSADYSSVLIYPTVTGLSITGNLEAPLIDLNGADFITIDGRVDPIGNPGGTTKDLTITNTSVSIFPGTTTIQFINDASYNTVKYCKVKGSSTDASAGILFFSETTGTTGNNDNTVDNNDITNAADANRPVNAVYSLGSFGMDNSGNTISNNNIFDYFNPGMVSSGVFVASYSTGWNITGNSFYETRTPFVPTDPVNYFGISIGNPDGNNFTVSNNFIGGTAPECSGTMTVNAATDHRFIGIDLAVGTTTASSVQNNTIQNIAYTYESGSNDPWCGIYVEDGNVNVGTATGNTIGSTTGTGSITVSSTSAFQRANTYGIFSWSGGTVDIQHNRIGSITTADVATQENNLYGIINYGSGTITISNNTIGSTTTPNSLYASSACTDENQGVYGIYNEGGIATISGNTISNLTNGITNPNDDNGTIMGIRTRGGPNTITNNIVRDLTIGNSNTLSSVGQDAESPSVIGISQESANSGNTVSGNTIYNLSNTYPSFAGSVIGLYYEGGTGGINVVSRNFIHSLSVTGASSASANLRGIKIMNGATTYSNNIISLGGNTTTNIYGIDEFGESLNNNNLYFNTVYLGGTLGAGALNESYALYSAGIFNIVDFRNNIFHNVRSTAGGSDLHYAAYFVSDTRSLTCDYNDYIASGTGGVLGNYAGNVYVLPIVPGQDAYSLNTDPDFFLAGGTVASNYVPSAVINGLSGEGGITTDYAGTVRADPPTMGAYERGCPNPTSISISQTNVNCYNAGDGTITISATGGYTAYEYSSDGSTWVGGPGSPYIFTGLTLGTYTLSIRDAAHTACVHQCGVTDITQPPLLSVTTSSDQTVCEGTTFTVSVSVTGGTGPYSYHWEDPIPSATIYDNAGAITGTASFSPHNGTWHVTVTDSHSCTISGTAKLTVTLPHTLTGTLKYNNTETLALGRLQNVELWLYDDIGSGYSHHDPLWEAVTAGTNGAYSFSNICCGTYRLAVHTNPYYPGSINATDAYQVQYWWQINCTPSPQAIQLVNFWAGDVYGAGSGLPNEQINSTDAERIQAYFVYGGNCPGSMGACFDRLTWSYAKAGVTVACEGSHPTSADEDIMVNVCGANKIQDLLAQVTGDFNGSYVAGGSKDASAKVRLTYGQTKQVSPNREFDLPVYVVNPMKVGATSLILNFPANLVEVKNVIMDGGLLDWNMNGNELRIGWHTLNPVSLNAHANLVTLHLKTTGDFKVGTSIRLSLASNDMNELADQFAKPIPDAILSVDVIEASPIGIPENLSASDLTLDNHPNPFSNETMFNYSLPFDGRVTLVIHNLLGETVRTLVNESQTQGDHTIRFDAGSMATGVYTATIKLDANSARLERTIKLIRNK